jgi:hypothetical protein
LHSNPVSSCHGTILNIRSKAHEGYPKRGFFGSSERCPVGMTVGKVAEEYNPLLGLRQVRQKGLS